MHPSDIPITALWCKATAVFGRRPRKDQPGAWSMVRDAFARTQERIVFPRAPARRRRWLKRNR
jgi:hypothetical protein